MVDMEEIQKLVLFTAFVVYDMVVDGSFGLRNEHDEIYNEGSVEKLRVHQSIFLGVFWGEKKAREAYSRWTTFAERDHECLPQTGLELRPVSLNEPVPLAEIYCEAVKWSGWQPD